MYFTGLSLGWLARNPQWSNILLNLSQVWTLTREVKFMHHHSDWLPPSCSGASLKLPAGVAPERNGGIYRPSLSVEMSEEKQTQPLPLPLQPQTFFSVVNGCVRKATSCTPFLWKSPQRNGEWCLPTRLLSIMNSSHGFVDKLLPLTISEAIHHSWDLWGHFLSRAFSCLVTVKQHSTSPCTHCSALWYSKEKNSRLFIIISSLQDQLKVQQPLIMLHGTFSPRFCKLSNCCP